MSPKRVNVLIGDHNSGKSNILEALTWLSTNALDRNIFPKLFRFKNISNFFFNFDGTQTIEVLTNENSLKIRYAKNGQGAILNNFEGIIYDSTQNVEDGFEWPGPGRGICRFTLDIPTNVLGAVDGIVSTHLMNYSFERLHKFESNFRPFLNPPFGDNIPNVLQSNKEWKQLVSDFFRSKKFRLIIKPVENEIEMVKEEDDEFYGFPYVTISETMQRYVFLLLALSTNNKASLILDEPETNMFPFFIKDFAEKIAIDEKNQYFIATHNPYLLNSLVEKTPIDEIAVFVTRMNHYQTTVDLITESQMNDLASMGSGVFFNIDNIINE